MDVVDGRGLNKTELGLKNREKVREYFIQNPGSTMKSCIEKTGLGYKTIRRHLDYISNESV